VVIYSHIVFIILILVIRLDLETTRTTTTAGLFELASLAADVRLDVGVGVRVDHRSRVTKVRQGLARFGAAEEDRVGALGGAQSELVQGDALATGGQDALAGRFGKSQGADGHFGAFEHTHIVRDFGNNDSCLSFFLRHVFGETVQTDRRLVRLAHVQALQDGSAEFGVCSARQKLVELDKEFVVWILALDCLHGAGVPHAASTGF